MFSWLGGRLPEGNGSAWSWNEYFLLANASVYEEVVTRFLFLGVPLAMGALALGSPPSLPEGPRVPAWRHLLGGTLRWDSHRAMIAVAAIFVIASSVIFGLAHVPGWGWWKFLPTFVGGLAMGYLFVRHGILAAILFHFATDYLAAAAMLTASSLEAQLLVALLELVMLGLGLFFLAWYFVHARELGARLLVSWGLREPAPAAAAPSASVLGGRTSVASAPRRAPADNPLARAFGPPPGSGARSSASGALSFGVTTPVSPPYGRGWVPYACPRCGWREARYDAGRFTCLRCAHVA